jgi:hypothetical protein
VLRNIPITRDGLYSIQAGGGGLPGAYALRLLVLSSPSPITPTTLPTPTPQATPSLVQPTLAPAIPGNRLEDHIPVMDSFDSAQDVGIYPIFAAAGEIITIGVSPAEGSLVRPRIEVISPDGQIVARADSTSSRASGDALIPIFQAETEGVYQAFVTSEDGSTGDYIVGYGRGSTWREMMRGPVAADQTVEGLITRRGGRDLWAVQLTAGDIIAAAASIAPGSQLDPVLELVPAGEPTALVAIDDNSGGDRNPTLSSVPIETTGLYFLRVRATAADTIGGYSLIWRYVNRAPTPMPPPATALVFTIDDTVPDSAYAFYPFQGQAGMRIRVVVLAVAGSEFDPVAALLGPEGEVLIEADDTEGDLNARFTYTLPETGTFTIRVNGYLQGGPFVLTVEQVFVE